MSRNLIPDYQPEDGSYQVGGGDWRYGQDMVGMALDTSLTGVTDFGDTHPAAADGLGPLEGMLYRIPLPVLKMFRPFTWGTPDADWDDQYTAVQDILKSFRPKIPFSQWWQEFIDSIANMWGGVTSGHTVKDAIDSIKHLLEVAQAAKDSATNAQIGIEKIIAGQKGGWHDEFDLPLSLHTPPGYTSFQTGPGTGHWAPNGKGILSYRAGVLAAGLASMEILRADGKPLAGNEGTFTVVLSKAPAADPITRLPGAVYVCVCMSATNQECVRFHVTPTTVTLEMVSATGAATTVGTAANLPHPVAFGNKLAARYTATTIEFLLNDVTVMSHAYTQPTGRLVAFGGSTPTYGAAGGLFGIYPPPEFAGIAAHP